MLNPETTAPPRRPETNHHPSCGAYERYMMDATMATIPKVTQVAFEHHLSFDSVKSWSFIKKNDRETTDIVGMPSSVNWWIFTMRRCRTFGQLSARRPICATRSYNVSQTVSQRFFRFKTLQKVATFVISRTSEAAMRCIMSRLY